MACDKAAGMRSAISVNDYWKQRALKAEAKLKSVSDALDEVQRESLNCKASPHHGGGMRMAVAAIRVALDPEVGDGE